MCDGTLLLAAVEMEKYGGPYLVHDCYYTPWDKGEIVECVTHSIILSGGEVQDSIARKMQEEFQMAEVSVEEVAVRFFFPLTKTCLYIDKTGEVQKSWTVL